MANLWDQFKRLFQQAETSSPSQPAVHELIQRTEAEQTDYERWKSSLIKRRLIDWLADQYAIFRVLPDDIDAAIDFLNTPSSKGFVVHFHETNYNRQEITHLFDYLKEMVLQLNYRTQVSDTRTYSRANWVETTERHYLKPRSSFVEGQKLNQRYGNIMIELEIRDDLVRNLRFRATTYKDRQFEEADPFEDLMNGLLVA